MQPPSRIPPAAVLEVMRSLSQSLPTEAMLDVELLSREVGEEKVSGALIDYIPWQKRQFYQVEDPKRFYAKGWGEKGLDQTWTDLF